MSIFHDYSRKRETGWWHSPWMTSWTIERRRCQGLGTTHRQFDIHNWFFCFQWVPSNTKDSGEYIVSYRLKVPKEPSEQCRLIQCTNAYFLVLQVITLNTRVLQRNTVYQKKYCKPSEETHPPYLPTYVICTNHLSKDDKEWKGFL